MVPTDDLPSNGLQTRRTVLRRCAGLLATGVTTLSAGCTAALPPLGSRQHFGRVDVPDADPPTYRQWLPAPTAVDTGDDSQYPFCFRRPQSLTSPAPVRFVVPQIRLRTELDYFGVGYTGYNRLLETRFGTVLAGGFDPTTITNTLTESGYRRDGTYREYERFSRSDVHREALVTDEAIVWASQRVHEHPNVEALVDARDGRIPRYHEENDAYRRLSEVIGESRMVEFIPPEGDRQWTKLEGFRFGDDTAYHIMSFLYPEEMEVPEADLRDRSIDSTILTREVDATDFRVDGQLAVAEGRIPLGEGYPLPTTQPPQITWGVTRNATDQTLTFTHEAGESVATADLQFRADIADTSELRSLSETRPLPTDHDELGPGDSVTIDRQAIPDVEVIHADDIDWDAADPYATSEPQPATRLLLAYSPESATRPLFAIDLEDTT
ncbi:hypothetical protein C453_19190 [Haloferax elongans ATCC BAA-1513]|uniref:Uncharacterized protein n=1 Tax=Haloferax elongans ATCC BAA-1513 TaxID=1230453 RepID=M0HAT9_HALEO|nr:hypothetical protein [Haloferax elongans]ELZ80234.1 hypothetical protein C453_19190 [Haloferax elongans ATCC BAA-1513]